MKIKYILHPGFITSKNDNDSHYITYNQLLNLYKLNPKECVEYSVRNNVQGIHLYPDYNGNYELPKDKYYVPKLEEFHLGFEFEFAGMDSNWFTQPFGKMTITNKKFSDLEWIQSIFNETLIKAEDHLRVKYLDREDIESLGWKKHLNKYIIDKSIGFPNETIRFVLEFNGSTNIRITKFRHSSYGEYTEHMQFKINNKSELRKLMQQLNIL